MIGLILLNIALILVILVIELPKLRKKNSSECNVVKPEMSEEEKNRVEKVKKALIEEGATLVEVKDHEPALALKAGEKGLDIYKRLISEAPDHLVDGGILALEIGCTQADDVTSLMKDAQFVEIKVIKDLTGLDRVVIGYLKYKRED